MTEGSSLPLAFRLARRELRGGLKGFRVFLACIVLGVAAIAGVGSLTEAVLRGLAHEGRVLLGGDLDFSLLQREASDSERALLQSRAERLSAVAELRAMAIVGEASTLVELKAVDSAYPLFGTLKLDVEGALPELLAPENEAFGALVEPAFADRLGLAPGQSFTIGAARFVMRGTILKEPDRVSGELGLGPRVLVSRAALDATKLIEPGSLITFRYRLALSDAARQGDAFSELRTALKEQLGESGFRIRDRDNAAPGLRRFVLNVSLFFGLVALTALVVGGVGVGNAVHGYLESRRTVIATLKSLGATRGLILQIYLIQVLLIAALGVVLGLGLGVLLPPLAESYLAGRLPIEAQYGLYASPFVLAAAYGLITALAFALWPLGRAQELRAASLFRDLVAGERQRPRLAVALAAAAAFVVLALLAVGLSTNKLFAAVFVAGAAGTIVLLVGAARLFKMVVRRMPRPRRVGLRLALANLDRPGAPTVSVMLSLGLGLTLFVAIVLIDHNIRSQIRTDLPERAPAFFIVDIQRNQADAFRALVQGLPGVERLEMVPSLRGQIRAFNGAPAERDKVKREVRWALDGDRGVTYSAAPPKEGSRIVAGTWWPSDYRGPPLISFDADLAAGFGLKLGDTMTVRVLGRDITGRLASLRAIDYSSGGLNYTFVFSPGVFEAAPHTYMATAYAPRASERAFQRAVTEAFPNITIIGVRDAIETVNGLLGQLATAVRVGSLVTIAVGILVLAGAIAAGHRHRLYDAVVLKVLGATRARDRKSVV